MKIDHEVGIIGGGPAGAALAGYLAKAGISCAVFERETFPRAHVGESFVPASTRVFEELGFLGQMEANAFPRKYGAVWTTPEGRAFSHDWQGLSPATHVDIRFKERAQQGVAQEYTYHVDRAKFDHLFLEHARSLGANVHYAAAVEDVDLSGETPRIRVRTNEGPRDVRVRMVADASGRSTLLGGKLGMKVRDSVFDQFALHSWFEGYDRGSSGQNDYIFVHFLPLPHSWIWQIPITPTITSIGVVTQKRSFLAARADKERFFWDRVASRPDLEAKLRSARQMRPLTEEADYSYAMKELCGDKFILIGDAARFVDPIFSSGVSIALNSARLAAQDIVAASRDGRYDRARFRSFETTMKRGLRNWHRFISLYYRLNVLFTAFVRDARYRLDILKLLQGDMYDEDSPAVLDEMSRIVSEVENNPDHVWRAGLSELTAKAFETAS